MSEKRRFAKCPKCDVESEEGSFTYRQSKCPYCNAYLEYFEEDVDSKFEK